mgnify:CR=1 FL=1
MAAKDLVTLARAKQSNRQITDGAHDTIYAVWITAASDWVEKYCKRHFYALAFDELYNGSGDSRLLLREYPVQIVTSVRHRPQAVLRIQNTDTTANQRATVRVTSTGLTLVRVASGVVTTVTSVTFSSNVTLTAVKDAVIALGVSWTAAVVGDGKRASADLYVPPSYGDGLTSMGALNCCGVDAALNLHTAEMSGYDWDPRGWLIRSIPYSDPELADNEAMIWPAGFNNFRVQYTAGYTTIPEAVQEAVSIWVAALWALGNRDPMLLNNITSTTGTGLGMLEMPPVVSKLLDPYRRLVVGNQQG